MKLLFLLLLYLSIAGVLTIIERKIIGLIQSRVSNYKFSVFGIFQFFIDFLKLINKALSHGFTIKVYKSSVNTFMFFISNMLFVLFVIFFIKLKDYFISSIISLIIFIFVNMVIKIICSNYFSSFYVKHFIIRLKVIIIIIETLSTFIDLGYIIIFGLGDLNDFLLTGCFDFNILLYITLISFTFSLIKSFRCPMDFIERESECLNSLFINVFGIEYALWTLFEYLSVMNNFSYILIVLRISLGLGYFSYSIVFIITLFIICFIRAISIRFKINLLFSILLSLFIVLSIFFIIFIIL